MRHLLKVSISLLAILSLLGCGGNDKPATNKAPTAKITTDKTSAKVGETIIFSSKNSTDSDGSIVKYEWLEGSTSISTKDNFGKSDFTAGAHTIKLVVTDNSGATDEDTITIKIINNPPLFVSSNPEDNRTNISKDVNPSVTFDKAIDIKNALISFKQGSSNIAFTKSVSGSTFTIKPSTKLSSNTKYTLTFSKVEDSYGLAFVGSKTISFTTAEDANFDNSTRTVNVDENQKDALTIKANGTNLTYTISEGDSDDFIIDKATGVVTFKKAPDYETKSSYTFKAFANDGSVTASQTITVNINDIVEHTLPELSDTNLNNIYASLPLNTTIGKVIVAKNGDDAITGFTLSGTNHDDFSVDINGDVKIAKTLDFATKPSYSLEVFATNAIGNSQKVGLSIKLTDKAILNALVQDSKNGLLGFGGTTYHSILSSDKKLYTVNDWKFKVYDTQDLTNMKLLNTSSSISASNLALSDDQKTAYILSSNRLIIYNISDLENIQKLGELSLAKTSIVMSITIKDNTLYIGVQTEDKIYVVDVNDKSNPSLLQTEDIDVQSDLLIVDNKLYVDYYDGSSYHLASYDIGTDKKLSNKTDLISKYVNNLIVSKDKKMIFYIDNTSFGIYTIATNSTKEITISTNVVSSMKISDDENTAYIGGANEFIKVDISDKTNPLSTSTAISVTPETINILNSDTFLFGSNAGVSVYNTKLTSTPYISNLVSETANAVVLSKDEKSLFVGNNSRFYIYDTATKAEKGSFSTGNIRGIAISKDEKTAFVVSNYEKYFKILNISNPSSISKTKAITMSDSNPNRVALSHDEKYAFTISNSSILIYNISNLSNPQQISSIADGGNPILTNDDKYLFLGNDIYDISNPASPNKVGSISAYADAISENGKFLYASTSKAIKIYDISTPSSPKEMSLLDLGNGANIKTIKTTEDENTIFARTDDGLYSIDVSNKNAPKLINSHKINIYDIAISKDLKSIYVGGYGYLSKLDLSLATLYKRKNFADFDLSLIISDNLGKDIAMTATDDSKNIVNIGSYSSTLTPSDYQGKKVTIPISAVADKTGTTVITVVLNDTVVTQTKKIYLNVID